jgi:hypothetical protein
MRLILSLVILAAVVASCTGPDYEPQSFLIRVDTVIRSNDTAIAVGRIGPNGCYRLDHRTITETDSTLRLKYFGLHDEGTVCTQALVSLTDTIVLTPAQRLKRIEWK